MARIEDLAELYGLHIATPWQRTVAGAQRVIMVTYEKELERTLRARKGEFENRTRAAGYDWVEIDLADSFARWLTADEYREAYFESPDDLRLKLEAEFPEYVADKLRAAAVNADDPTRTVVAVLGVASLFGFARVSHILKLVEPDVRGRLHDLHV